MTYPYQKICFTLLDDFQPRTKDILIRRFGLGGQEPQTLEAIGHTHGLTRERIRQIVEDAMRNMREEIAAENTKPIFQEVFAYFRDHLKRFGHLKREDLFVTTVGAANVPNYAVFLLHLGEDFHRHSENEDFHTFWADKAEIIFHAPKVLDEILEFFEERKEPVDLDELEEVYLEKIREIEILKAASESFSSFLEATKHIMQGYDGRFGLRNWSAVNPRGVREKAYIVLKTLGKPLHFTEVARSIEELQKKLPSIRKRTVLPQTVHNELIKDPRFVLVGRGMYALSEWGYEPGTVKEVMVAILKKNGNSMKKEELIKATLQQRHVKESTILLNLQDRNYFERLNDGRYQLKEKEV